MVRVDDPPAAQPTLQELLASSERRFAETGCYQGIGDLVHAHKDRLLFERFHSRILSTLISVRDTMKFIASSPGVREIDEYVIALYTPEGDSVALSTGIMVHVHTLSEFIKYVIRNGYEDDPGIDEGDIFANNESWAGGVHTPDVQMLVPVHHEGRLVAWVGSVSHELEVGTAEGGGMVIFSPERYGEGLHISAEKVGRADRLSHSYLQRIKMSCRNPAWWILDEKSKLAGCLMVREAVRRIIEEFGLDYFTKATREIIEEGRRNFVKRVKRTLVPGRYRSVSWSAYQFSHIRFQHPFGRRDSGVLRPVELSVTGDGHLHLDLEGASRWGFHPYNSTPSGVLGGMWITLVQTLNFDGKVNDGAYHAVSMNLPVGSVVNGNVPNLATSISWGNIIPVFSDVVRLLGYGYFARGFLEEVMQGTNNSLMNGAGYNQFGELVGLSNFELAASGSGARAVADGIDCGHSIWNPEALQGDVEIWELISPKVYLGRNFVPDRHGFGRFRSGQTWGSLWMVSNTELFYATMQGLNSCGVPFVKGMFGGYPAPGWRCMFATGTNLRDLIDAGAELPAGLDDAGRLHTAGQLTAELFELTHKPTWTEVLSDGDLFGIEYAGGSGFGDPLERDVRLVERDLEWGFLTPGAAETVYGVVTAGGTADEAVTAENRRQRRRDRLEGARPVKEWWLEERQRVAAGEVAPLVAGMYASSAGVSPAFAEAFARAWAIDDFPFGD